jgi:predicted ester cyclase
MTNTSCTADRNRATVERFFAGTHSQNMADLAVIDETVVPGIVCHGFPGGLDPYDHDSYKDFFRVFQASFTGITFDIDALVADDRFVCVRFTIACDHTGAFAGVEPSGKRVEFDGMVLYRMENGLIAETWLRIDEMALLGQIGAIPALAA